eukprot:6173969-Pleurochrysis_carterae.AAC.2
MPYYAAAMTTVKGSDSIEGTICNFKLAAADTNSSSTCQHGSFSDKLSWFYSITSCARKTRGIHIKITTLSKNCRCASRSQFAVTRVSLNRNNLLLESCASLRDTQTIRGAQPPATEQSDDAAACWQIS